MMCLIVEDEAPTRFAFKLTLEKFGYEVMEAEDAMIAYYLIQNLIKSEKTLDFILLDLYLPSVSGLDLIDKLKEEGVSIPLLVTSGFLTPVVRRELEARDIEFILPKPFKPDRLEQIIEQIKNKKRRTI